ncbi:hypothetical protein PPERSA_10957 [Pseudocohnilembus persalinus]|uniref:Uncharacterized protein n=1 Tax=Pseudocohnilembus persalinus TaxID=266149 RepID=A0A0V0QC85_PSEPJ|nr:hypothetical protein PPERSA_10957 [Pseudocohnilembus persalinus]|eukprot:KRW99838.1 hypothetical protein PPERSA_10957 [Pseudocohnilembus persalinus]
MSLQAQKETKGQNYGQNFKQNTNVSLEFKSPQFKSQTNSTIHGSFEELNLTCNYSNSPSQITSLNHVKQAKTDKANTYLNNSQEIEDDEIMEEDSEKSKNQEKKSKNISNQSKEDSQQDTKEAQLNLPSLQNLEQQKQQYITNINQNENNEINNQNQFPQFSKQPLQYQEIESLEKNQNKLIGSLDQIEEDDQSSNKKQNKKNNKLKIQIQNSSESENDTSSPNLTPSRIIQGRKKSEIPTIQRQEIRSNSPRRQTLPEFNQKEKEPSYINADYEHMYKIYTGDQIVEPGKKNQKNNNNYDNYENMYDNIYDQMDDGICEDGIYENEGDGIIEDYGYNYDQNNQSDGIIEDRINEHEHNQSNQNNNQISNLENLDLSDGIQEDFIDEGNKNDGNKYSMQNCTSMQSIFDENGKCNFKSSYPNIASPNKIHQPQKNARHSQNSINYNILISPSKQKNQTRKFSKNFGNYSIQNLGSRKSLRKIVHFQEEDDIPNYSKELFQQSFQYLCNQQQNEEKQQNKKKYFFSSLKNSPNLKPQNHKNLDNFTINSLQNNLDLNDNNCDKNENNDNNQQNNLNNNQYYNQNINNNQHSINNIDEYNYNNEEECEQNQSYSSSDSDSDSPTVKGSKFQEDQYFVNKEKKENGGITPPKYHAVNSCNSLHFNF